MKPTPSTRTTGADSTREADAIRAFVTQTLRAMDVIADDPRTGLDAAIAAVPELANDHENQAAILDATIATWRDPTGQQPFGTIDVAAWETSIRYLESLDMVPNPVKVEDVVRLDFVQAP